MDVLLNQNERFQRLDVINRNSTYLGWSNDDSYSCMFTHL